MATAPAAVTNSNEAEAVDLASVEIPEGVTSGENPPTSGGSQKGLS